MKFLLLFIALVFASEHNTESAEELFEQNAYAPILVKIEEDEYAKKTKTSEYIGVSYERQSLTWQTSRWSKTEKRMVHNGTYKDEETAAHASDTLARKLMANGEQKLKFNFPDDDTEVHAEEKATSSQYIGVYYHKKSSRWNAIRRSKNENKMVYNGGYNDNETAAHASDTLARQLMANGEHHKLNFPNDHIEVYPKLNSSKYVGVNYRNPTWRAIRWSKNENKNFCNGSFDDEETAAHASDTLAKKLMANGEQNHKLNFPDDDTEVHTEKSSKYIGVNYSNSKLRAMRWSKNENKMVYNGGYNDKETAAHASDTLARTLMANGEHGHKLNFPDDDTEVYPEEIHKNKRKRSSLGVSQADETFEFE